MPLRPKRSKDGQQADSRGSSKGSRKVPQSETDRRSSKRPSLRQGKRILHSIGTATPASKSGKQATPPRQTLTERINSRLSAPVDNSSHVIIQARAGTGKTTTLTEGVRKVRGQEPLIDPSDQQDAIWQALMQSVNKCRSTGIIAFSNAIAAELKSRVPQGTDAITSHGLGLRIVNQCLGKLDLNEYRTYDLIAQVAKVDIRTLRRQMPEFVNSVAELVKQCKQSLIGHIAPATEEALLNLASEFDVDLGEHPEDILEMVPIVLDLAKQAQEHGQIDWTDMIWLPIVLDLHIPKYDMLMVDEAQDLNRCQQSLAMKAGRRIILVGDPKQAIFGFAGADADSMPRMQRLLEETDRGVQVLPLTVTRRCAKSIVREAQRLVPDIEAHPNNPEGLVSQALFPIQMDGDRPYEIPWQQSYIAQLKPNDFVLCRTNAPLVSQCFRLLKMGRKASIQGRDIGGGLIRTIDGFKANIIEELIPKAEEWYYREVKNENAKTHPSENRLIMLKDRYECIQCFIDGAKSLNEVVMKIHEMFVDNEEKAIRLSSLHRSKGLEADRVFFCRPKIAPVPHYLAKSDKQLEQEFNLDYVGRTRAKQELWYVQ